MSNKPTNNVKDDVITLITTTLTFMIMLGVMWWQHDKINQYKDELYNRPFITVRDTVTQTDTLWRDTLIYSKPKVIVKTDTISNDSTTNISLIERVFSDTLNNSKDTISYAATVRAHALKNDSLPLITDMRFNIRSHTVTNTITNTITNTVYVKEKEKFHLKLRPTLSIGYDPIRNQIAPTVGIGLTY